MPDILAADSSLGDHLPVPLECSMLLVDPKGYEDDWDCLCRT